MLPSIPEVLKGIDNAPARLYAMGDTTLLEHPKIAIIGSRRPFAYTKEQTFALASAVSAAGGVVVSGGAMGVDAIAHRGAGERTIAVMANSLDIVYPKVNRPLIEAIYTRSLALSEHEKAHEARRYDFILRNRIVVGLSQVVVVTQADLQSGSMSSARMAVTMGKPLFVLSHRLGESEGTQSLLAQGVARPIVSIEAFLKDAGLEVKREEQEDEVLHYLAKYPDYHSAVVRFGNRIFEYELEGKITVANGQIRIMEGLR